MADPVKVKIGRSLNPYGEKKDSFGDLLISGLTHLESSGSIDNRITEEEAVEVLEDFEDYTHFSEYDQMVLHGSPSEQEDDLRYDLFETAALYLEEQGNDIDLVVPEKFREKIQDSEVIEESSVRYMAPDITEDELTQTYDRFRRRKDNLSGWVDNGRIHVTSDYHANGVEGLSRQFDEDQFVVLSADTEGERFPGENYTEILGPLQVIGKLPNSWKFWAEGKEVGRELKEKFQGPRF
ncbi:MAG: hypothetical protein R6V35_02140 [Candidatus Nanohaloarchaea archaeon]